MPEKENKRDSQYEFEVITKIKDIDEKQRLLKERLSIIGQNLIESKEKINNEILEIKRDINILKRNIERVISFIETISSELSKFAKREDLEILYKQARMFQPFDSIKKEG
ncbi:MAG: hypothetical protein QXU40_02970 [Candidatus Pacearchaeota archaeon]